MLKTLIKKQIFEVWRSYFYDAKKNKARSKLQTVLFFVMGILVLVGMVGGMFFYVGYGVCGPLIPAGLGWMYYIIMGALALLLGVFGSVFNTFSSLYRAGDNELLLSLPISEHDIILSRLVNVYLLGLMYSGLVLVPAIIGYIVIDGPSAKIILGGLYLLFLLSILDLLLSCVFGWIVAQISGKIKNKGIVSALAGVLFIIVYYFVYFKAMDLIEEIVQNVDRYGNGLHGAGAVLVVFGKIGVGEAGVMSLLLTTLVVVALTLMVYVLMKESFLPIATRSETVKKKAYDARAIKSQSLSKTLLARERMHFLSSATYMLNCGLGLILMPAATVMLAINSEAILSFFVSDDAYMTDLTALMPVFVAATMCMLMSMNDISAPSVSLEGKSLWIVQSLPVSMKDVLHAKECLHVQFNSIPGVICTLVAGYFMELSVVDIILSAVIVWMFAWVSADFGLLMGLKMPIMNWTSQTAPIKQSLAVAIALFGSMALGIVLVVASIYAIKITSATICMTGIIVVLVLLYRLLHWWLMNRGARILEEL